MVIPGLEDRKQLEEARLARVAIAKQKRERSISPPSVSRKSQKTSRDGDDDDVQVLSTKVLRDQHVHKPPAARTAISHMMNHSPAIKSPNPFEPATKTDQPSPASPLMYPKGTIKKTWAFGHERRGNDVKIEEVLEPRSVRTAVLSAFQWDLQWVLSKLKTPLNNGDTKCIFIMQAKTQEERVQYQDWASKSEAWLRVCLPPMYNPIFCMHSKLMLLFHKHKLRVAIPTANLLNFDWGETGLMENSVFMIDLPRLGSGESQTKDDLTNFGKELFFFVEKQGLYSDVREGLLNFDFAATEHMAFLHTVGGVSRERHGAERTGLFGLSQAVRNLGLASPNVELDFAASSIGQLNDAYLQDFHAAAAGQDIIADAVQAKSTASSAFFAKGVKNTPARKPDAKTKIRIYFPTKETVQASTAGAAGTICLQRKYFEGNTFPRSIFRDYISTRAGLLSHNKILLARSRGNDLAWVYVGSANMSKSAWGELPKDRTEKKITCRNWECGVLLPVAVPKSSQVSSAAVDEEAETESESEGSAKAVGSVVDTFKKVLDIPFEIPGDDYNSREPWYFTEEH